MSEINIKKISFVKRPIPIPADYRPLYKIAQICLILKYTCIGSKSGLLKLHLLSWALKRNENSKMLLESIESNFTNDFSVWGIEPTLNRALHIAVAEKYCTYTKGKYCLDEIGEKFIKKIENDGDVLVNEIAFLKQIGKRKLTEKALQGLSNKWTLFND